MSLLIRLQNRTASDVVNCYVTGTDANTNSTFLLQADGKTLYYPASPGDTSAPLGQDCAIPLSGPSGTDVTLTIPTYVAGGRIWFCVGSTLTFLLNPGEAGASLVEPSVTNSADPNIDKQWDFCEFSFNSSQAYINITYVDFMCLPIALTLYTTSGSPQHVSGTNQDGLSTVVTGLQAQAAADGQPWDQLIYESNGSPLRVLSPNSVISSNNGLFSGYFEPYVEQVWNEYSTKPLTIDTQASYGNVNGQVVNDALVFSEVSLVKPNTGDIFSNSTGPFVVTDDALDAAIVPRLAAGFNRTTMLLSTEQPNGVEESQFYANTPTNHYSRIVHSANIDGKGYTFPYDDVTADGAQGVSGAVYGPPTELIIAVGGNGAGTSPAPQTLRAREHKM